MTDLDRCAENLKGKAEAPLALAVYLKANRPELFKCFSEGDIQQDMLDGAKSAFKAYNDSQTSVRDLSGVEIFSAGTWNQDVYSRADLQSIADAHNEVGKELKPYIKLGHDPKQYLVQRDGWPSAGWVDNLRVEGDRLLADFKAVPRKIADLVDRKAYGRVSSEIYWNLKRGDKTYPRALKAVALLGGDTPAVRNLNDFVNLYGSEEFAKAYSVPQEGDENADIRAYGAEEETENMAEVKELEAKLAAAEAALKSYKDAEAEKAREYSEKLVVSAKEAADSLKAEKEARETVEKQYAEAKTALEAVMAERKRDEVANARKTAELEIETLLTAGVKDGKVTPRAVAIFKALAVADTISPDAEGVRTYSFKDNDKDETVAWKSAGDLVKDLLKAMPKVVNFTETSVQTEVKAPELGNDRAVAEKEVGEKARAYIDEQKAKGVTVTFAQAIKATAPRRT